MSLNKTLFSIPPMLLLALLFAPAYSAEQDQPDSTAAAEESVENEVESEAEEEEVSMEEEQTAPVEDRFIPTSQISEDLSVSFPVNI